MYFLFCLQPIKVSAHFRFRRMVSSKPKQKSTNFFSKRRVIVCSELVRKGVWSVQEREENPS